MTERHAIRRNGNRWCALEVEYQDGRLSICGAEGDIVLSARDHYTGDRTLRVESCGQIPDMLAEWFPEVKHWLPYHLNDMRAGCEHQRATWDTMAVLTLQPLTWGPTYHDMRRKVENGDELGMSYAEWQDITRSVQHHSIGSLRYGRPSHPNFWGIDGEDLVRRGYLQPDKQKTNTAGWVRPTEHPDGLLCKPCEVCGYQYGTKWLREELPADIAGEVSLFLGDGTLPTVR